MQFKFYNTMNYKLLKERIKNSRITFRECSSFVGLTEAGLRQSIEGERITVSVFEKLCKLLGDSPMLYLDPIGLNHISGNQNQIGGNGNSLIITQETAEISALKQRIFDLENLIESKNQTISTQEKTIELLTKNK